MAKENLVFDDQGSNLVGMERMNIRVPQELRELYYRCYTSLGWIVDSYPVEISLPKEYKLCMQRSINLKNRPLLQQHQQYCESLLSALERTLRSCHTAATMASLTLGFFGAASIAAGFIIFGQTNIFLFVALNILGALLCLGALIIYPKVRSHQYRRLSNQIEEQYALLDEAAAWGWSLQEQSETR